MGKNRESADSKKVGPSDAPTLESKPVPVRRVRNYVSKGDRCPNLSTGVSGFPKFANSCPRGTSMPAMRDDGERWRDEGCWPDRHGRRVVPSAPPVDDTYFILNATTVHAAPNCTTGGGLTEVTSTDRPLYPNIFPDLRVPCPPPPLYYSHFYSPHFVDTYELPDSTSSVSTSSQAVRSIVGRTAARFEIRSTRVRKKAERKRFNPILLTHRGCTDVCCCMLFTVFIFGWAVVAFLALMWGKPQRLIHPTDSLGRICGYDRPGAYNLSSRPYLLFFDLTKCISYATILGGCPTPQVCVAQCPTQYFSYLSLQSLPDAEFHLQVRSSLVCKESVNKDQIGNFADVKNLTSAGQCAAYTVNSVPVMGRCLPGVLVDAGHGIGNAVLSTRNNPLPNSSLNSLAAAYGNPQGMIPSDAQISETSQVLAGMVNSTAVLQKIASDLSNSWWQILGLLGFAAATSFIWTVVMRILGGLMIYASMLMLLALLGAGSTYSWLRYQALSTAGAINDYSFQPAVSLYFEMPNTWLAFAIALSSLLALFVIVFLFVYSRIRLAVALIGETSKALACMLSTLFYPFFPLLLHLGVFALWASITVWVASVGEENCRRTGGINPAGVAVDGEKCDCASLGNDTSCNYVNMTRNENTILLLQAYNLFGFFWVSCFISALSDMTLAGAFASFYFAFRKPRDVPSFPVLRSTGRAIRYHLGTMAFGSLVLSIVRFFQVVLDFIYSKLKGVENPIGKAIYHVLSCFFWCLEHILRFLSRNAYVLCAIYGKGFCQSARDSFSLLARNLVRVVVLNRTTGFLLFTGKAVIVCGMGALSFFYFSGKWSIEGLPQICLYYYFVPIIIVIVGSYFICDLFFQVYNMGVDTIFLCFLEDIESNDGTVGKPYYMSDTLKKLLGKENNFQTPT